MNGEENPISSASAPASRAKAFRFKSLRMYQPLPRDAVDIIMMIQKAKRRQRGYAVCGSYLRMRVRLREIYVLCVRIGALSPKRARVCACSH
jgi:hypothetical protein